MEFSICSCSKYFSKSLSSNFLLNVSYELANLLYTAAREYSYVNAQKIQEILGVREVNTSLNSCSVSVIKREQQKTGTTRRDKGTSFYRFTYMAKTKLDVRTVYLGSFGTWRQRCVYCMICFFSVVMRQQ